MLKYLFRKVHERYTASANGALLGDFAAWLVSAGYAPTFGVSHGWVRMWCDK
jgi:integrase/recombinase XerD